MPTGSAVAVLLAVALAAAAAWRLARPGRSLRAALPDRFWYGLPWGTLVVVAVVLAVYLFLQGGLRHWNRPLSIPFRAWSYLYPTGILTSGFAHNSPGHLIGNLTATVVLAPLAEYAWGHYPPDRGERRGGPDGGGRVRAWLHTPWIRALVAFPAGVLGVGLLMSPFELGPVIGFSGVVFALAGFALVQYPVAALVALLLQRVVRVAYDAATSPILEAGISQPPPSPPGWAEIAVQGHALGLLVGVVLGLALLYGRERRPDPLRVFVAALVYVVTRNVWAIYWYRGEGEYVLFRAAGFVLVLALAVLVTAGVAADRRPVTAALPDLEGRLDARRLAGGWLLLLALGALGTALVATAAGWPPALALAVAGLSATVLGAPAVLGLWPDRVEVDAPTGRQTALGALLVVTAVVGGIAVFPNLVAVEADSVPSEDALEVGDYTVTYAEDVRNGMIPAVDLPGLANATNVRTSGVIVVSERRHVWLTRYSRQYLQSEGVARVEVGGVGWRETVLVRRTGWLVAGNETVYTVDLQHDGRRSRAFTSPPAAAEPVIANRTTVLHAGADGFRLSVLRAGERLGETAVPAVGNRTTVGGLTVETRAIDGRIAVFASADGTRVRIAQREHYG